MESARRASALALAPLAVIAIIAAATSAPLWRPFFVYGHSIDLDPFRQLAFDAAIRAGDWFPRWTPCWYYGYGAPLFHFYAPLPYYVSELWLLAGASLARAFQLTLFSGWLASGLAMYLCARDALSRPAATVAAVLYLFAPYHLVDMLVRHALGEHLAFVWIPLALWGVAGSVSRPGALRFAIGALAVAALPLTHNLTALIALPVVIVWSGLAWARTRDHAGLARAAAATGLGLALSAFFWPPGLADLAGVSARERLTGEYFRYSLHFVAPLQLFRPAWGFGSSRAGVEHDGMSFQIGLLHWALVALAGMALAARVRRTGGLAGSWTAAAALAVFGGATLMTTAIAKPLWDAIGRSPSRSFRGASSRSPRSGRAWRPASRSTRWASSGVPGPAPWLRPPPSRAPCSATAPMRGRSSRSTTGRRASPCPQPIRRRGPCWTIPPATRTWRRAPPWRP